MLVVANNVNLSTIKYYGPNDLTTNWFINEFQQHEDSILEAVTNYQDYDSLLERDIIFGFYLLNLFLLFQDVKSNLYSNIWDSKSKDDYSKAIEKIFKVLKLQKVKEAIKIFKDWVINNIKIVISEDFKNKLMKFSISYADILEIFLNNLLFDSEYEVKNLILLIEKVPYFYPKFSKTKIKHKILIIDNFKSFIKDKMKNKEDLIPNLELLDSYLNLIKDKKGKEGKQNLKLQEEVTCYCKKQIDQIDDDFYKISSAEIFMNLVNKYGLKFKCTSNLSSWYEELKIKLFNSNKSSKTKFSYNPFKDNQNEYNDIFNKIKNDIKNNGLKNLFYDKKNKTAFSYKSKVENPWSTFFNNSMGTYGQSSQYIEMSQSVKLQFFLSLFSDEEVFKLYTENFADILECVLYNLGVIESERIFFIARYYEIIDQLNEERQNKEIQNPFLYWKKNALLLSAIDNFIKIFIEKIENESFTIVSDIDQSISRYLGNMDYSDIKKGPIFKPSKYIKNFLPDDAKDILNYYLFAKISARGLEIRNPTMHGSYISEKFLNQYYFFKINLLFFQLVEEMTMNYILNLLDKIDLTSFLKDFEFHQSEEEKEKVSDFIRINEERLNNQFQKYLRKKKLIITDYAIDFKIKYYHEQMQKLELEAELFKTFLMKIPLLENDK